MASGAFALDTVVHQGVSADDVLVRGALVVVVVVVLHRFTRHPDRLQKGATAVQVDVFEDLSIAQSDGRIAWESENDRVQLAV
jgi:hypothetical protein